MAVSTINASYNVSTAEKFDLHRSFETKILSKLYINGYRQMKAVSVWTLAIDVVPT